MLGKWYADWMVRWETALTTRDTNRVVRPLEWGFLSLGLLGSWMVAWSIAQRHGPSVARRAFAPWAVLCFLLWLSALWLLAQPMEMRATMLAG